MSTATYAKVLTVRKWITELDPKNEWLKYVENDDKVTVKTVFCELCRNNVKSLRTMRNFSNSFIDGVSGITIKKDSVNKHLKSDIHLASVSKYENTAASLNEFYKNTPIGKSMAGSCTTINNRVQKLIDISHVIAKEEISFMKFPKLVELELRHGVDLGQSYLHKNACVEFTECISDVLKDNLMNDLQKTQYFSVFIDSSTDVSVLEHEIVYVMYVNEEGEVKFCFLKISEIKSADALGIKNSLIESFIEYGVSNFGTKLIGFLADGASVNMGIHGGVGTLLKKMCPWLIVVHCLNHCLELSIKDFMLSTYFQEVAKLMEDLHNYYEKSSKRIRKFKELAEVLEENVSNVAALRVYGTRWIGHLKNAVDVLLRNYTVIVTQLETIVADPSYWAKKERAKLIGLLRQIKSVKFVCWLLLLHNILLPLSNLSLVLQCDDVDVLMFLNALERLYDSIKNLKDKKFSQEFVDVLLQLRNASEQPDSDIKIEFRSIELAQSNNMSSDNFNIECEHVLDNLWDCVYNRLGNLQECPVFRAARLLEPKLWPTDKCDLANFGCEDLKNVIQHFKELLAIRKIEEQRIINDWNSFKLFWYRNLQHMSKNMLWKCLKKDYSNEYSSLVCIIDIIRILLLSNAKIERACSAVKRIKTDNRNRLSTEVLNNLLTISLEGPELCKFNPEKAVAKFFDKKDRRPSTQPYGKRIRLSTDSASKVKPSDVMEVIDKE